MSVCIRDNRIKKEQEGVVLPYFVLMLVALSAFMAYSVDVGAGWSNKVDVQRGADQGALAGVLQVQVSGTGVNSYVTDLIQQNGLTSGEVTATQCGVFNPANRCFTSCSSCTGSCTRASCMAFGSEGVKINAVRVATRRSLLTTFARIVGISNFFPTGEAIAVGRFSDSAPCIMPLGVDGVSNQNPLTGVGVGGIFNLGVAGPGNWGKLDIGGNMSSGTNFRDAMLNGTCSRMASIGSSVSAGTGFGGSLDHVMDQVLLSPIASSMVISVTTRFPNGNGNVQILEFIRVAYKGSTGSGGNWQGRFQLLERNVSPPVGGGSVGLQQRYLVEPQ